METLLAVFGLIFVVAAAFGSGMYIMSGKPLPVPQIAQPYPRARGLLIQRVNDFDQTIEFVADSDTAASMRRYGNVRLLYTHSHTGDRYWILYVSLLTNWDAVKAATLPALPQPKREMAIVQHQGWMS